MEMSLQPPQRAFAGPYGAFAGPLRGLTEPLRGLTEPLRGLTEPLRLSLAAHGASIMEMSLLNARHECRAFALRGNLYPL